VSQVGEAIGQMDQTTQQNAALVEEMAAAASSLKTQAQELVQVVATFKIGNDTHATLAHHAKAPLHRSTAPKPALSRQVTPKAPAAVPKPAPKDTIRPALAAAPKTSSKAGAADDDWETF
jgi:hypothetical protein